jgi:hypothetical protein
MLKYKIDARNKGMSSQRRKEEDTDDKTKGTKGWLLEQLTKTTTAEESLIFYDKNIEHRFYNHLARND